MARSAPHIVAGIARRAFIGVYLLADTGVNAAAVNRGVRIDRGQRRAVRGPFGAQRDLCRILFETDNRGVADQPRRTAPRNEGVAKDGL